MQLNDHDDRLSQVLDIALSRETFDIVGIAVSGGSDSLALLHLMAERARHSGLQIRAVTVDHGLRPEAAGEADFVAEQCKALGIAHTILRWQGWDGAGNLQDQARRARYRLMAEWANSEGMTAIALGHTADDQAETVLMRLARGAGVDGLSGMADRRTAHSVVWLRPLLQVQRQQLRDYLVSKGLGWLDDPSNEDCRFDRVKARQALAALSPLGIGIRKLATVASNLRDARKALEIQTQFAAESLATVDAGDVVFDRARLAAIPVEIGRRLMRHATKWVSSAEYGPRGISLVDAYAAVLRGRDVTLHGCHLLASGSDIRVTREYQAVREEEAAIGAVWDHRWRISGPENKGLSIRALSEAGLRHCPDWRDSGRPRVSLLAGPAVWRGDQLLAAPLAGRAEGWSAALIHPANHFNRTIISH